MRTGRMGLKKAFKGITLGERDDKGFQALLIHLNNTVVKAQGLWDFHLYNLQIY